MGVRLYSTSNIVTEPTSVLVFASANAVAVNMRSASEVISIEPPNLSPSFPLVFCMRVKTAYPVAWFFLAITISPRSLFHAGLAITMRLPSEFSLYIVPMKSEV